MDDREARQLQKDLKMIDPMLERLFVKGDVKKLQTLLTDGPYLERHPEIGGLIKKYDAVKLVKIASEVLGGKGGGGRKDFAQAGGTNKDKIEEAFKILSKKIN